MEAPVPADRNSPAAFYGSMGHMARQQVLARVKEVLVFGDGRPDDASLDGFRPPDPEHFGCNVQVFIGQSADDRYDSFDIVVCSPSWFAEQVANGSWDRFRNGGLRVLPQSIVVRRGLWFMRRWVVSEFKDALTAIADTASPGPDWGSVADRIGRLIPWEFDYKYDKHIDEHYGEAFPPVA